MVHVVKKQRILAPGPQQVDPSLRSPNRVSNTGDTSKNLRWTSVALCEKMRIEKVGISSQVADDVAAEAAAQVKEAHPDREVSYVERNTRRRVYDALKVLVAIGCIERDAKSLKWVGVDHVRNLWMQDVPTEAEYAAMGHSRSYPAVQKSKVSKNGNDDLNGEIRRRKMILRNTKMRIETKKNIEMRLMRQINTYEAVGKRKREQNIKVDRSAQNIAFPMLVIKGRPEAIKAANKFHQVTTVHEARPQVYTEADIVNLMCAADPSLLDNLHQSHTAHAAPECTRDANDRHESREMQLKTQIKKRRWMKARRKKSNSQLVADTNNISGHSGIETEEAMMDDRVIRSEDLGLSHLSDQLYTDSESESVATRES